MKKRFSALLKTKGICCILGSCLTLVVGGCEPVNDEILAGFILDLAGGALAAWLL
jgi:hypothetical protein